MHAFQQLRGDCYAHSYRRLGVRVRSLVRKLSFPCLPRADHTLGVESHSTVRRKLMGRWVHGMCLACFSAPHIHTHPSSTFTHAPPPHLHMLLPHIYTHTCTYTPTHTHTHLTTTSHTYIYHLFPFKGKPREDSKFNISVVCSNTTLMSKAVWHPTGALICELVWSKPQMREVRYKEPNISWHIIYNFTLATVCVS